MLPFDSASRGSYSLFYAGQHISADKAFTRFFTNTGLLEYRRRKDVDIFYKIIALLGGLSMFLYGMRMMGDELKKSSGGTMKAALAKVTNKPAIGFIFGMLVTCMIQSSTATIVLTVGLVGAGFMTFRQSVGIVLGANVGTAITAQIIRLMDVSAGSTSLLYFFKADNLAPVALIIGIIMIMFLKGDRFHNIGSILIGFGILFMGLIFMGEAVSEMGDGLSRLLTAFEDNYLLGFLSGVLVTGIIQSSSAVIGIIQTMASSVGVHFCGVFAVIIGVNIGDCITTFIVSRIGAKPEQIRTALVHVIYNVIAALLIITAVTILRLTGILNDTIWNMTLNSGGVANLHGIFRLVPAILLLPFSGALAGLAEKLVPDREMHDEDAEIENNLRELDSRLITNPTLALDQVSHLIRHMADVSIHNYDSAVDMMGNYDDKRMSRIKDREDLLDRMADASNRYLIDISPHITQEREFVKQSYLIKVLTCFERIGDHAINIAGNVRKLDDHAGSFSESAMKELTVATDAVRDVLTITYEAFMHTDVKLAAKVEPMEEVIDALIEVLKNHHIHRMTHNLCDVYSGLQYENILSNLERISDQCSDLAVFILSSVDTSIMGSEHQYIYNLHHSDSKEYLREYEENYRRYFNRIQAK